MFFGLISLILGLLGLIIDQKELIVLIFLSEIIFLFQVNKVNIFFC